MRTNNPRAPHAPACKLVSDKAMERANKAISVLISECLASDDPLRFSTVERLARVGQDLRKAVGMRASDHMQSPAAEELLALHLFLRLPGHEQFLRDLQDGDVHYFGME
jgi:hypothetical protein